MHEHVVVRVREVSEGRPSHLSKRDCTCNAIYTWCTHVSHHMWDSIRTVRYWAPFFLGWVFAWKWNGSKASWFPNGWMLNYLNVGSWPSSLPTLQFPQGVKCQSTLSFNGLDRVNWTHVGASIWPTLHGRFILGMHQLKVVKSFLKPFKVELEHQLKGFCKHKHVAIMRKPLRKTQACLMIPYIFFLRKIKA